MGACSAKSTKHQQNNLNNKNIINEDKNLMQESITATPKGQNEATIISKQKIDKFYEFKKYIGSGGFGIGSFYNSVKLILVRLAQSKLNPGKVVAIKSIPNDKLNSNFHQVKQELLILKQLDHPNVIKFHEIFQDSDYYHIVTEYCPNGDLLNYIYNTVLSENDIKKVIYNLLLAVGHLHAHNICHRDIKPQNILFTKNNEIKLIDFGLSVKMNERSEEQIQEKVGTLLYAAPEVLTGKYSKACDLWSIGIILFILLSGEIPYDYEMKKELYQKVKLGAVAFDKCLWDEISEDAANLLKKMLIVDPSQRIDIKQALNHPWISELNKINRDLSPNIIHNIYNNFMVEERFKKELLRMIVSELSEEQILKLKNAFKKFDINNRGMISFQELETAIKNLGLDIPEEDITKIMKIIHTETSNLTPKQQQINYSEFIASTLDFQKIVTQERVYILFKELTGEKKTFNRQDLKEFMERKGRKLSNECLQQMMDEIDFKQIGEVDFEQFNQMLMAQKREEDRMPEQRKNKKSVSKILAINKNLQNEDLF